MVTSDAVSRLKHLGVCYGSNYDCNTLDEGVAMINEEVLHSPYKEGVISINVMYIATFCIRDKAYYRFQIVLTYGSNVLCGRTYKDSGWSSWNLL